MLTIGEADAELLLVELKENVEAESVFAYFQRFISERSKRPEDTFDAIWNSIPYNLHDTVSVMPELIH